MTKREESKWNKSRQTLHKQMKVTQDGKFSQVELPATDNPIGYYWLSSEGAAYPYSVTNSNSMYTTRAKSPEQAVEIILTWDLGQLYVFK